MKKIILLGVIAMFVSCTQIESGIKDFQSNTEGLDRNIYVSMDDGTVFVYSGNNIRVDSSEYGNKVIVQINGKRLAVYNASIIVEEKGLSPDAVFGPGELAKIK